jgi:hypothetical protein
MGALSASVDAIIANSTEVPNGDEDEQAERSNVAAPENDALPSEEMAHTHIPEAQAFNQSEFAADVLGLSKIAVSDVSRPTNEYQNLQGLLSCAFPWLFPTGAPSFTEMPSPSDRRHFLLHHSGRFAHDFDFLFYLFNLSQRVERSRSIAMSASGMMEAASNFLSSRECIGLLESIATKQPNEYTEDEKKCLVMANRLILMGDKKIPFTKAERNKGYTLMLAMIREFGAPSWFVTITPSGFDNLLALKFCGVEEDSASLAYEVRSALVLDDPVAAALFYQRVLDLVKRVLYRVGSDSQGIFGRTLHFADVTEDQVRMLLHSHCLLWTDLTASAVDKAMRQGFHAEFAELVDSVVVSKMPQSFFDKSQLWWLAKNLDATHCEGLKPIPDYPSEEWDLRLEKVVHVHQLHRHKATCAKGNAKRHKKTCRFGFPTPPWPHPTGVALIRPKGLIDTELVPVHEGFGIHKDVPFVYPCSHMTSDCTCASVCQAQSEAMMMMTSRPAVPEANNTIAAFNPTLTTLLACNTAVVPCFLAMQSRALVRYLVKYVSKDALHISVAARAVTRALDKRDLRAAEENSDENPGASSYRRFTNAFTNAFSAASEIPVTVACATLLGVNGFASDITTWLIFPWDIDEVCNVVDGIGAESEATTSSDAEVESGEDDADRGEALESDQELCDEPEVDIEEAQGQHYKLPEGSVFVRQRQTYEARCAAGETEYAHMSYVEYFQVVRLEAVKPEDAGTIGTTGRAHAAGGQRRAKPRTALHALHPTAGAYTQYIGDDVHCPILAGRPPPALSSKRPTARVKRRWAAYWSALVIPWELDPVTTLFSKPVIMGFHELDALLSFWLKTDCPVLQGRARYALNTTFAFNCESKVIRSIQQERFRFAENVSAMGQPEPRRTTASVVSLATGTDLAVRALAHINALVDINEAPAPALAAAELAASVIEVVSVGDMRAAPSTTSHPTVAFSLYDCASVAVDIADFDPLAEGNAEQSARPQPRVASTEVNFFQGLNDLQVKIANAVVAAVDAARSCLIFVQGAPGTGKSFMMRKIREAVGARHVVEMAPTGVAAQNLSLGADTVHAKLKLPITGKYTPLGFAQKTQLAMEFAECKLVVVDEISMVSATMFYKIMMRLKEAKVDAEFGGLVVVVCGDFWQIPPVQSRTLLDSLLDASKLSKQTAEERLGAELFKRAAVFVLEEQMRARDCATQGALVARLRRCVDQPVDDETLSLVRPFVAADVVRDALFREPTFLVGTNRERVAINNALIVNYATSVGKPILRFQYDAASFNLQGEAVLSIVRRVSDEGQGLFVEGAPVMITSNVKTVAGVSNGVRGRMVAVVFSSPDHEMCARLVRANSPPGAIVDIPCTPAYLVVELERDEKYASVPTLESGRRLIPVALTTVEEELELRGGPNKKKKKDKVLWRAFPVVLAFALTFHKCQGLTLPRVVVCANKPCGRGGLAISYEMLLVALTRTSHNDHVRLMPDGIGNCYAHLKELKSNRFVTEYFSGTFDANGVRAFGPAQGH